MRTKFWISLFLLVNTFNLFSQNSEWTTVNPWRYNDIHYSNHFEDELYFFDKCEQKVLFLDEDLDVTHSVDLGLDLSISSYFRFEDKSVVIGSSNFISYYVILDQNNNVVFSNQFQEQLASILQLKKGMLFIYFSGENNDEFRFSFVDLDTGEEYYSFTNADKLPFQGLNIIEDNIYFNYEDYIITFKEGEGIVDTLNLPFLVSSMSFHDENTISLGSFSENIFIVDKLTYEIVDTIKYPILGNYDFQDQIFSHKLIEDVLYVSSTFQLIYSEDLGQTWHHFDEYKNRRIRYVSTFIFQYDNSLLFRGFGFESIDLQTKELKQLTNMPISSIRSETAINDSSVVFINSSLQSQFLELWQTDDFGVNWYKVKNWDTGTYGSLGVYLDVNEDFNAIYYARPDTIIYFSEDLTSEWMVFSNIPFNDVIDVFITNEKHVGVVTSNGIYMSVDNGTSFQFVTSFGQSFNHIRVIDGQDVKWIVTADFASANDFTSSVNVWKYDDVAGISEKVVSPFTISHKLAFDVDFNDNLVFSTGNELVIISSEDISISFDCEGLENLKLYNYHNQDSIMYLFQEEIIFTSEGCDSDQKEVIDDSKASGYLNTGRFLFNKRNQGIHFGSPTISVFREAFTPQNPTSTEEFIKENKIEELVVFPNPTTGEIFFKDVITIDKYQIVNSFGQMVQRGKGNDINIRSLPMGTYFVLIESGDEMKYGKVVKM